MVDIFIHDQKAVVDIFLFGQHYRRILGVVLGKVLLQGFSQSSCMNFSKDSVMTLGKHQKYTLINIVINKNDRLPGRTYQIGRKYICIKYPTVIKDSLYWR